ncbi:MAG TPA: hypothetical protein VM841_09760 [Actinomycetota bacterium]|nr:hypothetical protein [Actinomycetota bacterium]
MSRRLQLGWIFAAVAALASLPAGAQVGADLAPTGHAVAADSALIASPVSSTAAWTGTPTMIAGTSRYDAGEWIYTDFVYDDYGADTTPAGQPNIVSLASTSGDFRYPRTPAYAGNAADVVEVRTRVAPNGSDLEVRVLLQTIVDPDVVALWVSANDVETIVTTDNAVVNAAANTVTFTLAGAAADDAVVLNIGAGLNNGSGELRAPVPGSANATPSEFTSGAPTNARLFDLAFNTHAIESRGGAWNEDVQSDAIHAGDLGPFVQTIDVTALKAAATTPVPDVRTYHVRLFESRQQLGANEGIGTAFPQYLGRFQPYAIWVPESYVPGTPVPLFLNMHSLSVHHNQYRGGAAPSATYRSLYEQYEAKTGAIIVTPLGRGPDGWYEDEALVDTLEVWKDALDLFTIDRDRVYIGGYSMGGYGTYRLGTLIPDAFASAAAVVAPPANGIWAFPLPPTGGESNPDHTFPQLENTRHIPYWLTNGMLDELVPVSGVTRQAMRLGELGHTYRYALHPAADHFAFAFADEWTREASWLAAHPTRAQNPDRVTLKVRPASWVTSTKPNAAALLADVNALVSEVGARLDGAYWVGNVQVASGADVTGIVDLRSGGVIMQQTGVSPVATVGADGPSPYLLTGQDRTVAAVAATATLSGSLSKVTSVTVDVGRAGLSDTPVIDVTSDTPAVITLVRNGVVVGTVAVG